MDPGHSSKDDVVRRMGRAIVATDANDLVRPLHDRMPAMLSEDDWDDLLDLSSCQELSPS